jgi:adenylyltransferase/sulfurtransferase
MAPAQTTSLCGHDAVQVLPQSSHPVDLIELRRRLDPVGDTTANRFLLRFRPSESDHELTVFLDGRAIIKGTTDPTRARSLYARYVGA